MYTLVTELLRKEKKGGEKIFDDIRTVPTYSLITALSLYHLRKHLKKHKPCTKV